MNRTKLIGIAGKKGVGKDTVADIIQQESKKIKFIKKQFAGKIKEIGATLLNVDINKFEDQKFKENEKFYGKTPRQILQLIGDFGRNIIDDNVWIKSLMNELKPNKNYIITDVRFKNECEAIKENGGVIIKVNRKTFSTDDHKSENDLDDYDGFDFVIINEFDKDYLKYNVKLIKELI